MDVVLEEFGTSGILQSQLYTLNQRVDRHHCAWSLDLDDRFNPILCHFHYQYLSISSSSLSTDLQTSLDLSLSLSGDGFVSQCEKLKATFKKLNLLNHLSKMEAVNGKRN